MSTDPTDINLADLGERPDLVAVDGGLVRVPPVPLRETPRTGDPMLDGHNLALAMTEGAVKRSVEEFQAEIDAGRRLARHLEDLDHAAQAIVDAADAWRDGCSTHDALVDAVDAWRAVRDGRAS